MISVSRLEIETADHVTLAYDLAGAGNRGFAALVDVVVATLLVIGIQALEAVAGLVVPGGAMRALGGVVVMLTLLVAWAYFIALEWLWDGRTLGKRIFGLRVIAADGSPAGFVAILVRNLIRVVDFLPAFYGLGLLAIVVSGRAQRLGDLAAGTFVVRAPRPRMDLLALRTVAPAAPGPAVPVPRLPGELQRLVREFVAREAALDPARRREVAARIAAALRARLAEAPAGDDVELIRAVARSLRDSGGARP
ncbi:MAG: RDD family protein [Chloroflexota bacterium]|nr:RDD family protein [Chloroflexota bacterium]MDE3193944.1 RDD family protein [Chloroflexota bacterium]